MICLYFSIRWSKYLPPKTLFGFNKKAAMSLKNDPLSFVLIIDYHPENIHHCLAHSKVDVPLKYVRAHNPHIQEEHSVLVIWQNPLFSTLLLE